MRRAASLALAIAGALGLSACDFVREDINKTLGRSTERQGARGRSRRVPGHDDRRQFLSVARGARHALLRADGPGRFERRRDRHRLVRQPQLARTSGSRSPSPSSTAICAPTRCASRPRARCCRTASGSRRRWRRRPSRSSRRSSSPAPATCAGTPSPAKESFPMAARFNPLEADARWQKVWEEQGTFHARRRSAQARRPTCWRCSPIRRGASTWAMSATTRWATCSPATGG